MIKTNEVKAAYPLAELMFHAGFVAHPYEGSALYPLTVASEPTDDIESDDVLSTLLSITQDGVIGDVVIPAEHGYLKKRVVDTLTAGVKQVISSARNHVIPAIKAASESLEGYLSEKAGDDVCLPQIVVYNYDKVWATPLVDGIAERYKTAPMAYLPNVTLPDLTDAQAFELLKPASTDFKAFVLHETTEWEGEAAAIWYTWFQGKVQSTQDPMYFLTQAMASGTNGRELTITGDETPDGRRAFGAALLAFLMADFALENPLENTGMSSSVYTSVFTAFKNHFAKAIQRIVERRAINFSIKKLYIQMPILGNGHVAAGQTAFVNGDVYAWYLDHDGSVEALVGNLYTDRAPSADVVLKDKARFEQELQRATAFEQSMAIANRHTLIIQGIMNVTDRFISSASDEQWAQINRERSYELTKGELCEEVRYYLANNQLNFTTRDKLNDVLTYIFASIIYSGYSDKFIAALNNYSDQTLNPKVIATHVVLDLILCELVDQLAFEPLTQAS